MTDKGEHGAFGRAKSCELFILAPLESRPKSRPPRCPLVRPDDQAERPLACMHACGHHGQASKRPSGWGNKVVNFCPRRRRRRRPTNNFVRLKGRPARLRRARRSSSGGQSRRLMNDVHRSPPPSRHWPRLTNVARRAGALKAPPGHGRGSPVQPTGCGGARPAIVLVRRASARFILSRRRCQSGEQSSGRSNWKHQPARGGGGGG